MKLMRPEQIVQVNEIRGTCNFPGWHYSKATCTKLAVVTYWRDTIAGRMMDHADEYKACEDHQEECDAAVRATHPTIPVVKL